MARSRETKIELTAYDDLFQTDESREEEKLSKIRDIPIWVSLAALSVVGAGVLGFVGYKNRKKKKTNY